VATKVPVLDAEIAVATQAAMLVLAEAAPVTGSTRVKLNVTVPVGAENAGVGAVIVTVAVKVTACVTTAVQGEVVQGKQTPPAAAREHTLEMAMLLYWRTTLTSLEEAEFEGAKFAVGSRASGT